MKKRWMAVLLCVCMAAVLLTPYTGTQTSGGALRLGIAGAENAQSPAEEPSIPTEEAGEDKPAEAPAEKVLEATATTEPEATATTAPEATKTPAPKYTLDGNGAVCKDGRRLYGEAKDCVVKAGYTAQAYGDPTDRSEAKSYEAGKRVRVCDEIRYEDCGGDERKWSVVLDGTDFYFVKSEALEAVPAETRPDLTELAKQVRIHVNAAGVLLYGDKVELTAEIPAELSGVSMQWQQTDGSGGWEDVPGATGSSLTITLNEENAKASWRILFKAN